MKVKTKAFDIACENHNFGKWDLIHQYGKGDAIIISVINRPLNILRVYPYTPSKYRIVRFFALSILKLKVFFKCVK